MRKIFVALLLLASQAMVVAQSYQIDYKVKKGERPAIDLSKVSPDAYEKGKIRIKLTSDMDKSISADLILSGSKGYVETGIQALDDLNQKFGAQQYKPLLYNFYKASAKSAEYENRHRAWGFHLWFEIEFSSKADIKDVIKQYTELNEVEFAEPVYKKVLIANIPPEGKSGNDATKWTPSDTRFNEQWHYHNTGQQGGTVDKDIDLPEAWEIEKGNSAVIVAVVDGAVQTDHPDLSGNIWSGVGYNFVTNSSTLDPQPHGTHVGGTIAAETNNSTGVSGIAGGSGSNDGVRLMSCQVFTDNSSGGFDQAMIYAADNGAAISQNSWGYTSVNVYEQSVLDAIDYFNANGGGTVMDGGITIFAAGNDDATGNWYPGCYSGVLGVAATNNNDVRSYYSNYGTWVDISAPGGEQSYANDPKGILSTVTGNSYEFYQGTSMACPHVSGVAALLLSNAARHNFKPTSSQLRDLLVNNVDNHYDVNSSYSGQLGSGRLNANLAMQALQSLYSGGTPPATPTGLSSSGITSSSASLSWNAVSGATSYDVQIRPQGGTYSTYSVTTNSYTATGLTASTTYEWSVRAVNTYGTSAYAATQTFTTQVPQSGVTLPYSQTFNSSTIPTGWTTQNVGSGITERWTVSNTNKAGGSAYEMKCTYQNVNPGTTRLITPAINTSGVSQVSLTFRHMLDAYSTGVTLKVQTSNDKTSWTNTSWSVAATSSNINATSVTINITTNLNSPTTYIALVVDGNLYNIDYWYIDNVSIAAGSGATTPTVTTGSVSNITSSTATVAGNVTADGGATVTERGICYSTSQNPTIANSKVASGSGIGTFSANLSGLAANTTYYARAYATNAQGTSYGSQVSFTTTSSATTPTVTTGTVSNITSSTATVAGNVTADGGATVTERGICYSTSQNPTIANSKVASGSGIGTFSANLSGLAANTTYYARAYATNAQGTSYGSQVSFTTSGTGGVTLPYTQTFDASTIPTGWTTQNVGSGITERWTVSNTNKAGGSAYEMKCTYQNVNPGTTRLITPAINTSGVSQVSLTFRHMLDAYSTGVTLKVQTSNDKTSWTNTSWSVAATSSNINATSVTINITTNLNSPTTYIALVVDGNLYNIDYWYIDNVSIAAGSGATTPTVTTGSVSNITSSTATVAGNVTADGGATVTERGICYSTSQNPTIANSKVASGSGIGTFSANLSGLAANTTYYARAYATNAQGTSYGSQVSFTTSATTVTYCASKGSNSTYEWIDLVQFAGINRTSGNDGGYKDMTSLQATVSPGSSYTIYFSAGFKSTSYTEYWAIWIDYNHNGIFDDTEKIVSGSSSSSGTLYANITIPATATLGVTRMRVSMKYNSAQTACETFSYGEVEDYSVNITSGAPANTTDVPFAEELTNERNDIYTLYPNPASSMITIKLIGIEGEVTARIYDMRGAVVKFQVLTDRTNTMDINDLAPGVYMISIDDEKQPIAKQFIKQ